MGGCRCCCQRLLLILLPQWDHADAPAMANKWRSRGHLHEDGRQVRCFLGALLRDVGVAGTWGLRGGTGGTPQCCEHCVVRVGNVTKG